MVVHHQNSNNQFIRGSNHVTIFPVETFTGPWHKGVGLPQTGEIPAPIAQLVRALDSKNRGCGFDDRAGQPNNY